MNEDKLKQKIELLEKELSMLRLQNEMKQTIQNDIIHKQIKKLEKYSKCDFVVYPENKIKEKTDFTTTFRISRCFLKPEAIMGDMAPTVITSQQMVTNMELEFANFNLENEIWKMVYRAFVQETTKFFMRQGGTSE